MGARRSEVIQGRCGGEPDERKFEGEPTTKRSRPIRSPSWGPSASFSRPSRSEESNSSSCAHTADSHVTVTTPSRSATGVAAAASAPPAAFGQAVCTRASRVGGAIAGAAARSAIESRRGAGRLIRSRSRHSHRQADPPGLDSNDRPPHQGRAGNLLWLSRGHDRLPLFHEQLGKEPAALDVEL
jgi:hypothetical protein